MHYTKTRSPRAPLEAVAVLTCLVLSACTTVEKINVKPTSSASVAVRERWPLDVALVLDEGFANYTYRRTSIGTEVFPLGPSLTQYAQQVCGTAFRSVTVVPSVTGPLGKADCVLIPRVVGANFEQPLSGLSKPEMVLMVEWTLKDRAAQKTLWLATIEGRSKEAMGTAFTYQKHKQLRYQKLFDDLSCNTAAAFADSPEINRLVQPDR